MASQVKLSVSQREAVDAPWEGKVTLILATAGSGKTLSLTWRTFRIASELIQKGNLDARLLCVCFNKSAADEMAEELIEIITSRHMSGSIAVTRNAQWARNMVTIEVRTFHALGFWILRSSSASERQTIRLTEGKLKLLDGKEARSLIGEALRESGEVNSRIPEKPLKACSRACERPMNAHKRKLSDWECERLLAPNSASKRPTLGHHRPTPSTYMRYQERLHARNAIDFEDMICKAVQLATSHEQVRSRMRSRYTAVLVDEFQDLTPSEFMMCKILVEKTKSLTFVGDDDQQIYSFRSSQTWFSHELLQSWFSDQLTILQLSENRRCPGAVVKSARAVISKNSRRSPKDVVPAKPDGAPVRIFAFRSLELELQFMMGRIRALLPKVKVTKERILVLFRTNAGLRVFQSKFSSSKIATSTVVTDHGRAGTIGRRTSASFALITLMSPKTDKATFIWAAVTVSPHLERSAVERILSTVTFQSLVKSEPTAVGVPATTKTEPTSPSLTQNPKSFPSKFLEALSAWFEYESVTNANFPSDASYQPIRNLLERAEHFKLKLRKLQTASDLVTCVSTILSSDRAGDLDAYPELDDSQDTSFNPTLDGSMAGHELLTTAARKIDEEEDKGDVGGNATTQIKLEAKTKEEDQSEEEDFSSLFSNDKQQRSQKLRKHGAKTTNVNRSIPQQRARIGKKIQRLCEMLDSSLTRSEVMRGGKVSRTERPPTVLSTIHKAKGTTFAYVFLCSADTFRFPVNGGIEIMESGSIDLQSLMSQEERRMFFVALTRTQKEFVCTYSRLDELGSADIRMSQSPFLAEMKQNFDSSACISETVVTTSEDVKHALKTFR